MNRKVLWAMIVGSCVFIMMILFNRPIQPGPLTVVEQEKPQRPIIGFSVDAMVIERWQKDRDIIRSKAKELGYDVELVNAYEDTAKQKEQIRSLIKRGAVALCILPYEKDALSDVVEEAKKAGLVVIAYDRLILNGDVDAYVSFDNVKVGELMAGALEEKVPKGNYVIINGSKKDYNATMIREGFYNVLQPAIDAGDIRIIEEVWADNWREEYAYNTIKEVLERGERIDGIIGGNDRLAEGAMSVLSEYSLVGEVPVVGQDADVAACQMIVEDKQLMTVYKPIRYLAEGAVEVIDTLIHGKLLLNEDQIDNGSYEVPYIKFDVTPVNKENMEETVIKDLFHNYEDVYRE